jgi:capsid protein
MKEARDLEENGELAQIILGKFETHVAGHISYNPQTGSRRVDNAISEWFAGWQRRADYTERNSFRKMVQIALRSTLTDGDCGLAVFLNNDGEARVLGIEADRIGDPYDTQPKPNEFSGIHVDGKKAPTGYEVFERDEFDQLINPEIVPATNFCHLANPNKFDRYRGITAFHSVIDTAVDINEIVQFEKMAVKWGSMQTGVITGMPGGPATNEFYADGEFDGTGQAQQIQEITYGQLNYLEGKDAKIEQFKTERPGAAWEGFLQFLIRMYAAGFNLPYGFVFDCAASRGPGARFEAEQAMRVFEIWQELLVEKILDKVKNIALVGALARGDIPTHRRFLKGNWQFPPSASIDIGRESQADVAEMAANIKSHKTTLRKYSLNGFEEREQIAIETRDWMDLAEKHDIPLEMLSERFASIKAAEASKEQIEVAKKSDNGSAMGVNVNNHTPPNHVEVKTAPIHLNVGKEAAPVPKVKKDIVLTRKNGKITGASILEVPENGQATKRSVSLSKDKRARIDGNDILELPR